MKKSMNAVAMKTKEAESRATDGAIIEPRNRAVAPEDLSRFEGEGGPGAPVTETELIDVPLENAIWRRPSWAAHQSKQANKNL
jgi:hypothetical protein